jgi:hypothetical protein
MTLVPAYGRDYTSQAEALKAFNDNVDFQVVDLLRGGGYATKAELIEQKVDHVCIRYRKQRMSFHVNLKKAG